MPQSSVPRSTGTTAERQFTDVDWRDIFGDEAAIVGDLNGTAYKLTLPTDSDVVQIGSTTQRSLAQVAGFLHRIPAGETEPLTIPAPVSAARTDRINLRYDPAYTGSPGPVRLVRVAGTEGGGFPSYDDSAPGVEDMPLYAVTRNPGQALSQATVLDLRRRSGRVLDMGPLAALPTSAPLATMALQGGAIYHRRLNNVGTAEWKRRFGTGLTNNDKTTQPMISLQATHALGITDVLYRLQTGDWDAVTDQGQGLLTFTNGTIRCNAPGRIRVEALAISDGSDAGWSWLGVGIPFGGGHHLGGLDDRRARATGYPGAGAMRQGGSIGPVEVVANDVVSFSLAQRNTANLAVTYQCYLTVTYVALHQ